MSDQLSETYADLLSGQSHLIKPFLAAVMHQSSSDAPTQQLDLDIQYGKVQSEILILLKLLGISISEDIDNLLSISSL